MSARRRTVLAAAVLGLAAALRGWRLAWGLRDATWFPDEAYWTQFVAAFFPLGLGSFMPARFDYPTLYGYLSGLATVVAHAAGLIRVPGPFAPESVLVGRLVSAAAGLAGVAAAGLLGARLYGPGVGLVAAALLAVAPLHAMQSHVASCDVLLATSVTVALLAAWAFAHRPGVARSVAAGAAVGVAFTAKYPGLLVAAPLAWVLLEHARRAPADALRLAVVAALGGGVTVAVLCPPCVLQASAVLDTLGRMRTALELPRCSFPNNCLTPTLGWYGHPYLYQLVAQFPYVLGWPLWALALAGVALAVVRREAADRLLLASLVPYFLVMCWSRTAFARYLLPLFPALVVLAARAVLGLPRRAAIGVAGFVLVYSLALGVTQVARFSSDQQRAVAAWIAARVPAGGGAIRVAVPALRPRLDYFGIAGPLRAAGLDYAPAEDGHWFDAAPAVFVLPDWTAIALRRDRPEHAGVRDLERLESGAAGYRAAAAWHPWFLQRDFYAWLDPAFAGDLWQGAIGFTVWVRDPSPLRDPPPLRGGGP